MVFVISHVLEHGGDDILGPFCYLPRALATQGPDEEAEAGVSPGTEGTEGTTGEEGMPGEEGAPPVPEEGPSKEGVPSTAARVATEMRAAVKGRRAA